MALPSAFISFPGVQQVISGTFTLSHGIHPSTALLEIAPQAPTIPIRGDMVLTYGSGFKLKFRDCRVKDPSLSAGFGGRILRFAIQDRRWKWQYGDIYGTYNIKKADGTIDKQNSQEKTPQELATILLKAMGESGVNVSAIPNVVRPERIWEGNNPAEELAQLLDELGCRIGLGTDDKVYIWQTGTGRDLPNAPTARTSGYGIAITGYPDSIRVVCGPTRWQSKLLLEAVGLDRDGRVKPIDDLTYKPSGGWRSQVFSRFFGISNLADRRLAQRTVYKWYRIKSQADGNLAPPGLPKEIKVSSIQQLLPISGQLIQRQVGQQRSADDVIVDAPLPAYVEGAFAIRNWTWGYSPDYTDVQGSANTSKDALGNTFIGVRYVGGFSINEELGIVEFSDWVARRGDDGYLKPAELYLTCSYSIRDSDKTFVRDKPEFRVSRVSQGTGAQIIPASDITRQVAIGYGTDGKKGKAIVDNYADVQRWTQELAQQAAKEYQNPETTEAEYAGWLNIQPDGRIQQIQWEFNGSGAITRASANTEFDLYTPNFKQMREQQKSRQLQRFVARTARNGRIRTDPKITGAS